MTRKPFQFNMVAKRYKRLIRVHLQGVAVGQVGETEHYLHQMTGSFLVFTFVRLQICDWSYFPLPDGLSLYLTLMKFHLVRAVEQQSSRTA
ncbi:hypothetical protein O6P43_022296 [Quillaja saponaria]|uniref:Uncharacterized protein n=1 Tax=Quillaja saponaria TaxID=32244 RepID=A0AAD7LCT4_QUISA|nr:hypothetical protein O6P43_022296 [Quillaja saponaria]